MTSPSQSPDSRLYAGYVLAILVVVYTFNFIDRMIVGILAPPIKAELGLTDTHLGLLGGTAFALFYTALGIPIAWLADRFSRTWIMTVALALWSGFTAVCGFAQSFGQLFVARLGVGVGEAGGVAPAYSLISDYFPPAERARALAVYSFGIPLGSALGLVFGGLIADAIDWRAAFVTVGIAGVLLAPIFRLTVREPTRGRLDVEQLRAAALPLRQVFASLARKPSFWFLAFGAASSSIMGYGLFFWLPSLFVRSYGLNLVQVSLFYGAIVLIGGMAGVWMGGWLADRYGVGRRSAYALIPAGALLLCVPFYAFGTFFLPTLALSFFVFLVPTALGLVWLGPVLAAVQHLVMPSMRATASAIFLFINNLIGIGAGTLLIGALSDGLQSRFGVDSLRYAVLAGTAFYLVSAALFAQASRRLERDWAQ